MEGSCIKTKVGGMDPGKGPQYRAKTWSARLWIHASRANQTILHMKVVKTDPMRA